MWLWSADYDIAASQIEKIRNYSDLKVEIARLWKMQEKNVKDMPVVIWGFDFFPMKYKEYVDETGVKYSCGTSKNLPYENTSKCPICMRSLL